MSNNNYKSLYKSIENLKTKIKKIEHLINSTSSNMLSIHKISYAKNQDSNKKYIALVFNINMDSSDSSDSQAIHYIKLKKGNCIINYSLSFDVPVSKNDVKISSVALGIKDMCSSTVFKLIKGSKCIFDVGKKAYMSNGKYIINNTIIYTASNNEELCMIAELNTGTKIYSEKSLIKIIYL